MSFDEQAGLEAENANLRQLLAQAGIDAAEHKVVDRLQRILLEEMHHRRKNTLAIVQAIISQSLRHAENLEQARAAIESRMASLSRVQDLLMQVSWSGVKLQHLLRMATKPFETPQANQFVIESSDLEVSSGAALPLAMTLNELCTNAVKYGALSTPNGRVVIKATVDERPGQFQLQWVEQGGPAVREPTRRGFGMRLIEQSFVARLRGETHLEFQPTGVVCNLDIPLAALKASDAN
jgi:two-component sensor histidine kinase